MYSFYLKLVDTIWDTDKSIHAQSLLRKLQQELRLISEKTDDPKKQNY